MKNEKKGIEGVKSFIKKPSVVLRSVLYRFWEQEQAQADFQRFYERSVDKLVEGIQNKLNEKGEKKCPDLKTESEPSSPSGAPSKT